MGTQKKNLEGIVTVPVKQIVIVEDEESITKIIKESIEDNFKDIEVLQFLKGDTAFSYFNDYFKERNSKRFRNISIPLLISDQNLPDESVQKPVQGNDLISFLKSQDSVIRAILMTGKIYSVATTKETMEKTITADDFLEKPFEIKELIQKVQYNLDKYEFGLMTVVDRFNEYAKAAFSAKRNGNLRKYKFSSKECRLFEKYISPAYSDRFYKTLHHSNYQYFYGINVDSEIFQPVLITKTKSRYCAERAYSASNTIMELMEESQRKSTIIIIKYYFEKYFFQSARHIFNWKDFFAVYNSYPELQKQSNFKIKIIRTIVDDLMYLQNLGVPSTASQTDYPYKYLQNLKSIIGMNANNPLTAEEKNEIKRRAEWLKSRAELPFFDRSLENTGSNIYFILNELSKSEIHPEKFRQYQKSLNYTKEGIDSTVNKIISDMAGVKDSDLIKAADSMIKYRRNFDWEKVLLPKIVRFHDYVQSIEHPVIGLTAEQQAEEFKRVFKKLEKSDIINSSNLKDYLKELYEVSLYWNLRRAFMEKPAAHLYLYNAAIKLDDVFFHMGYNIDYKPANSLLEHRLNNLYGASINRIFSKLYDLSLPYLEARSDKEHIDEVLRIEKQLSACPEYKHIKKEIYKAILILHDNGWSKVEPKMIAAYQQGILNKDDVNLVRELHQNEGVNIAKEIFAVVPYFPEFIPKILKSIGSHDRYSSHSTIDEETFVKECDRLWRFTLPGFKKDLKLTNKTHLQVYEKLKKRIPERNFFYTDSGRSIAEKFLMEIKKEYNI